MFNHNLFKSMIVNYIIVIVCIYVIIYYYVIIFCYIVIIKQYCKLDIVRKRIINK